MRSPINISLEEFRTATPAHRRHFLPFSSTTNRESPPILKQPLCNYDIEKNEHKLKKLKGCSESCWMHVHLSKNYETVSIN
mmetsp:Transcript_6381/g.7733  ORF Transcript_6381/g.7733 Transcript_6381/m.7733 type:complete len:81 (-) Transcript_6381:22-264(-)